MFKKLGLGLSASDRYQRAFEKGVLLGDFVSAIRLFEDAANEYEKRGDLVGQNQALANARLYEYLHTKKPEILPQLISHLQHLTEIECIGSATETMPASKLAAELEARVSEVKIEKLGSGTGHAGLASAHAEAQDRFEPILSESLVTYPLVVEDQYGDSAQKRYYYHAARASWHRAQAMVREDPAAAAEEMSQAVMYYRRAGYDQGEQASARALSNLRLTRTCWLCGREMQGQGINFAYQSTKVSSYHLSLLEKVNQDCSSLDLENSKVAVCVVCQGLIACVTRNVAAEIAAQKVKSLEGQLRKLSQKVNNLQK